MDYLIIGFVILCLLPFICFFALKAFLTPKYIWNGTSTWERVDSCGEVGYECTVCGTWRYQSSQKDCRCNHTGPGLGTQDYIRGC